jgi:hypothetical protein
MTYPLVAGSPFNAGVLHTSKVNPLTNYLIEAIGKVSTGNITLLYELVTQMRQTRSIAAIGNV